MKYILALLLAVIISAQVFLEKNFKYPYGIVSQSGVNFALPQYGILDLLNIAFGQRTLGSDIAWIQVLQYYGTPESEEGRKALEEAGWFGRYEPGPETYTTGKYYDLLKYCQRVVWLDPFFQYTYLYGSASLAWNLNRDSEALELLDMGINNYRRWALISPASSGVFFTSKLKYSVYWQLEAYRLAIIYKKSAKYSEMVDKLEEIVKLPNVPTTIKAILANTQKKVGNYRRALELWIEIYESGPNEYTDTAENEIKSLRSKLKI